MRYLVTAPPRLEYPLAPGWHPPVPSTSVDPSSVISVRLPVDGVDAELGLRVGRMWLGETWCHHAEGDRASDWCFPRCVAVNGAGANPVERV